MEVYDAHPESRYRSSFMRSLETVKLEIPLEEYAGTLTDLEAFGRGWWTGRCPLPDHEDKTPSFYVYPDGDGTAHSHCYGCGFHGDVFDLYQACEGGELWVAMRELSLRFDVELPERPSSWFRRRDRQKPVRDGIEEVKVLAARRRLYRTFLEPLVLASEDPDDREHDMRLFWGATEPLARHLVENLMGRL